MTKKKTTAERLTELENRIADQEGKFNRFLEIQTDIEESKTIKNACLRYILIAVTICSILAAFIYY